MRASFNVLKVHFLYFRIILRLAQYDRKATYHLYRLGFWWELLSPLIQVLVYYLIFGVFVARESIGVSDIPYISWLLGGIIPWFFISATVIQGAKSIHTQLPLVVRTNFSTTILPSIALVRNLPAFVIMSLLLCLILTVTGTSSAVNGWRLSYAFFEMWLFLGAINLLNASITVRFRDYQLMINASMRLLLFLSGVIIQLDFSQHQLLAKLMHLNPLLHIIEGFRSGWFGIDNGRSLIVDSCYFWSITLIIFACGAYIHQRYQKEYVNYM
ncbi:ABC transporter permease [Brochothrix campestris]|uniref:Transport permease protein n=1 Tax=Brochothrix campestris FSL F6-1037 TaxID=1265861 RepID=W7CRE6_9LIST|nr:ABC transporter permease [Brochothrix campestris]EUJ42214.1 techoic acid ABC transporter efflux permease [Brochothrix campestris FSL F6-1037]